MKLNNSKRVKRKATMTTSDMKEIITKFITPTVCEHIKDAKKRGDILMKAFGFKGNE